MADPTTATPDLQTRGVFEDAPRSGLPDFAGRIMGFRDSTPRELLKERETAGEKQAQGYEAAADEGQRALDTMKRTQEAHAAERKAAKPATPTLTDPPSSAPRAFLQPSDSVLNQIQTAALAIGQMMLQAKGLRGSAVASVVALKGMAQGWQEGDSERVKREYGDWKAQSDKLLAQHRLARESYEDLLTDQHQSWENILAQVRVRAEISGNHALAQAARTGNIDAVLRWHQDTAALELQHQKFAAEIAHWHQQAEQHQQNYLATEAHRRETEARAKERAGMQRERLDLAKATSANVLKLQKDDIGIQQRLDNIGVVQDAVDLLAKEGVLGQGTSFVDKARVAIALQSKTGRTDILNAVNVLQRLGTPLVVGTEISLGMQGQTMRLKVIGEAEAGNIVGAPKEFWDMFLPKARTNLQRQQSLTREHLKDLRALGAIPGGQPEPDFEILSTTP